MVITNSIKNHGEKLGTRLTGLQWLSGNMKTINYCRVLWCTTYFPPRANSIIRLY